MSSQEGQGATLSIVDPGKGEVLGCRFGAPLEFVSSRWPGGHVMRGGAGALNYTLTQVVGRCAARLRVRYQFVDDAMVLVSLRAATELHDGLGRHAYQRVAEEVLKVLASEPALRDEGYAEYDVGVTRVVFDGLDAEIRFEERP